MKHRVIFVLALMLIGATFLPIASALAAPIQQAGSDLATASAEIELSNQFGRTIVTARGNHFIVDSAPPLGHPAEEMNPLEAMMASLATCGLFVYETAAQENDIPLTAATATVQLDFDVRGLMDTADVDPRVHEFRVHFDLEGPDAEQAAMLAEQFSIRCPIYTTLIKAAPIVITTNEEEMGGPVAEGLATAATSASLSNQPGRAIVKMRDNYIAVDSVPPLGGPDLEVNPLDLLLAAKASCGAVIMERAAIDHGIPLDGLKGRVEADFNPKGLIDGSVSPAIQAMRVSWEIDTDTAEHAQFLEDEYVRRCPILNTLVRATDIEVSHKMMGEGTALLDITFTYNVPTEDFQAEVSPLAEQFAATDGLLWKIWALDKENSQFSGLLFFENAAHMQAFLEGELAAAVMAHPALSDFEVTPYSIMADETMITRGPIQGSPAGPAPMNTAGASEAMASHNDARETAGMVHTHPATGSVDPIEGATAHLITSEEGAMVQMHTVDLEPGDVYTAWWVIANNPEACEAVPCSGGDLVGNPDGVQTEVTLADSVIVGDSGEARLSSFLPAGEAADDPWFGNGFTNPTGAEIHLVINSHGPLIPEMAQEMLNSYRGGCTDESLPPPFPETAKSDGEAGPNSCALVQAAVFQQGME